MEYTELGDGVLKRKKRRVIGLFIDGTGLDRATRRLGRKVEMSALVKGVTSGIIPTVARYYTLIPNEDDSRQRAFLDAVARAGLSVVVKRLPPKGNPRQVTIDIQMAADIVAFALGLSKFSQLSEYIPEDVPDNRLAPVKDTQIQEKKDSLNEERVISIVCPSREMSYPLLLAKELGVDTISADFGQFNHGDILKNAAKWIDLSDSETIWR